MSRPRVLTLQDTKALCMIAEDVLEELCGINFYGYDDEGNCLFCDLPEAERQAAIRQAAEGQNTPKRWDYIFLSGDETFRQTVFSELQEMPAETIQERYLAGVLPKARSIFRKGTMEPGFVVSNEVPDSVLNEIITWTWLGKLTWWTTLRGLVSGGNREGEP